MTPGVLLLCLVAAPAQPAGTPLVEYPYGCISQPRYSLEETHYGALELYQPQAGDIILGSQDNLFWKVTYAMAGTGRPSHAAMIIELEDGTLAVLESGYDAKTPWTHIVPLAQWRRTYAGVSWLRKRITPLTPCQKKKMLEFARGADDQPYALVRLAAQLTPFRKRGFIRTAFVGKAIGPGHHYTCVELVMEILVHAELLPYETTRPGATYPRDMFFDKSHIPYINNHLAIKDGWEVPRWWSRCYVGQ